MNPPIKGHYVKPMPFGGWLILPMIGLVIAPFRIGYDLFTEEFYNENIYSQLDISYSNLIWIIRGELVVNIFLLALTILTLIHFFQKRTSLPMLYTLLLISTIILLIGDSFILNYYYPELNNVYEKRLSVGEIIKSVLGASIWIPYFHISKRVKNTFIVQKKVKLEVSPYHQPMVEA